MTIRFSIAKQFSRTPGGRLPEHGPNSGKEFRELVLPLVERAIAEGGAVEISLDDIAGMPTAFIDEAFGGIVRALNVPFAKLEKHLHVTTSQKSLNPYVTLVYEYMQNAGKRAA